MTVLLLAAWFASTFVMLTVAAVVCFFEWVRELVWGRDRRTHIRECEDRELALSHLREHYEVGHREFGVSSLHVCRRAWEAPCAPDRDVSVDCAAFRRAVAEVRGLPEAPNPVLRKGWTR